MKFLRSAFLLLALMFVAIPAMAQTATNPCDDIAESTRGKTGDEVDTILKLCRQAKPDASAISIGSTAVPDAEEVNEWAGVAKGFAEAVGILAQKLGVAVNDFLRSPAGIILALILLVKHAGGVLIGIPFVLFSILVFCYVVRRLTVGKVTYESVPIFWGALTMRRKATVEREEINGDASGVLLVTGIALLFLDLIVCLNV